ncbi:hypothetical protein BBK14_13260 [Parafrankia soli]|uniref:Uncharacterized protein n=1 Tax=Parafrankia soli TaxID=2599596 RepID=A0A1S1R311_9ACTN|nr:hypothetical protein BBK14_13260 [Parafrankia soli]
MKLVPVATCNGGACPTIYVTDDGDVVVQGWVFPRQRSHEDPPDGEARVRIPRELLLRAADSLPTGI